MTAYLYIAPWLVGFCVFLLGPIVASLVLSFTKYNMLTPPQFVGLDNYSYILTKDPIFWGSVQRTILFALIVIVAGLSLSLSFALLLNQKMRGTTIFRTAFFIPSLTPIVAAGVIWRWILSPTYGPLNGALGVVGIEGPGWYLDPLWAIPALLIVWLWLNAGGSNMIIFLAGLQNVPQDLMDAAQVDGAGVWQRFRHVTLPMLSPTIFFLLVVGVINGLKVFALPYILGAAGDTVGGPTYATYFFLLHLYSTAFKYLQLGLASGLAWLFFLFVLALTGLQFWGGRRWVYYEAGDIQ